MTSSAQAPTGSPVTARPRLRSSVVGFVDLLGFSQQVMAATDEAEAARLLDKIVAAIADSRHFVRQELARDLPERLDDWSVKFFTDNLVLAYAVHDESSRAIGLAAQFVIRCTQRYQLNMALNGLFLRGGLCYGPVCITDEIIFGRALIECYQLESKVSIVPRVIVTPKLHDALSLSVKASGEEGQRDAGNLLCRDVDGWWFVNYLDAAVHDKRVDWSMIDRHRQSILESLATTTRHDVLPKFGWACRYHNMFCHWHCEDPEYADRYRVTREDERSTMIRLSDTWEPSM